MAPLSPQRKPSLTGSAATHQLVSPRHTSTEQTHIAQHLTVITTAVPSALQSQRVGFE